MPNTGIDRRQQRVRHRLRHVDHGKGQPGDQIGGEMAAFRLQVFAAALNCSMRDPSFVLRPMGW